MIKKSLKSNRKEAFKALNLDAMQINTIFSSALLKNQDFHKQDVKERRDAFAAWWLDIFKQLLEKSTFNLFGEKIIMDKYFYLKTNKISKGKKWNIFEQTIFEKLQQKNTVIFFNLFSIRPTKAKKKAVFIEIFTESSGFKEIKRIHELQQIIKKNSVSIDDITGDTMEIILDKIV